MLFKLILIFTLFSTSICFIFINEMSRNDILFSVRVSKEIKKLPEVKNVIKKFKIYNIIMFLVSSGLVMMLNSEEDYTIGLFFSIYGVMFVIFYLTFALSYRDVKKIRDKYRFDHMEEEEQLKIIQKNNEKLVRVDLDSIKKVKLNKLALLGFVFSIALLIGIIAYKELNFSQLPEKIVTHQGVDSVTYETKTRINVITIYIAGVLITILNIFVTVLMYFGNQKNSISNPKISIENYKKSKNITVLMMGIFNLVLITYFILLDKFVVSTGKPLRNVFEVFMIITVLEAIALIIPIVLAVKVGNYGDKLTPEIYDFSGEDDDFWKLLGSFYYNKNDSRLFVPKRVGYGFTLNVAKKSGMIISIALVVIPIILLVVLINI